MCWTLQSSQSRWAFSQKAAKILGIFCVMMLTIQKVKHRVLESSVLLSCLFSVLYQEILTSSRQVRNTIPFCLSSWVSSTIISPHFYIPPGKRQSSTVPCSCISVPSSLLRLASWGKLECSSAHPQWACRVEKVTNRNQAKARHSHFWHCWYPLKWPGLSLGLSWPMRSCNLFILWVWLSKKSKVFCFAYMLYF